MFLIPLTNALKEHTCHNLSFSKYINGLHDLKFKSYKFNSNYKIIMQNNDIRAQAELRRKKILANAEARLKKITGKSFEKVDISKVPEENELSLKPSNGVLCNGSHTKSEETTQENLQEDLTEINSLSGHKDISSPKKKVWINKDDFLIDERDEQNITTFTYDCYFFLALGLFVRYLFCLKLSWLFLNNILGPFIVASIPRLSAIFDRDVHRTGVLGLLTLLIANQRKYMLLLKTIYGLRTITQLFALYLFSFTVGHLVMADENS